MCEYNILENGKKDLLAINAYASISRTIIK